MLPLTHNSQTSLDNALSPPIIMPNSQHADNSVIVEAKFVLQIIINLTPARAATEYISNPVVFSSSVQLAVGTDWQGGASELV